VGFLLAIFICWITELFDPPFSLQQVVIETVFITAFGCATVFLTWNLIKRIKYLEGFLVICASCKQVRVGDKWIRIEGILANHSDLQLSHGVCPECAEKLYGKFLKKSHEIKN
jgi:hypothetical protein